MPFVWWRNMAVRRSAFDRIGGFDETLSGIGDEEEWERRYRPAAASIRYLAAAGLEHRRTARDARLRALAAARYRQGRRRGATTSARAPAPRSAVKLAYAGRVRVAYGRPALRRRHRAGRHSLGRIREALAQWRAGAQRWTPSARRAELDVGPGQRAATTSSPGTRVMSSGSGATAGPWPHGYRRPTAWRSPACSRWRLRRAAAGWPRRRVLALGIERADRTNLLAAARTELLRSRHDVRFASTVVGDRGKFENLNRAAGRVAR